MRLLIPLPCSAKDIKKMSSLLDGREADWINRVYGETFEGKHYLVFEVSRSRIQRAERVTAKKVSE